MDMKKAEQFWNYSKKIYEPLTAPFLFLQDRFGLDVNLLLLCFWLSKHQSFLKDREFFVLIQKVMPCRDALSKVCNKHSDNAHNEAELTALNMKSYLKAASLSMNQEIESAFEILIDTTFVKE